MSKVELFALAGVFVVALSLLFFVGVVLKDVLSTERER